jgi:hypothetical protein
MNAQGSTSRSILSSIVIALLGAGAIAAGCGGSTDDPFGKGAPSNNNGGGNNDTGGGNTGGNTGGGNTGGNTGGGNTGGGNTFVDASIPDGSTGGGIGCKTAPARYVVLGHSVAHCFAVGGVDSETCSLRATYTYMATKFPGLTYENLAVDGALITDVANKQLQTVKPGPGHLFVNLYIGGNDLAAHLYEDDATASNSWAKLKPQATTDYETILSYFDDKTKFPDGATILVNSQYNPFDECQAGIYSFVSVTKQGFITQFNELLLEATSKHANSAVVDQYTTFLGHGHNYNQSKCPKYIPNADYWMSDMIHPNDKGHADLLINMKNAVDSIYACAK